MAKLSFSEELRQVRDKGTHKAVRKFIKKRDLKLKVVESNKGRSIYHVTRKDETIKGGRKPLSIVVRAPDKKSQFDAQA